MRRGLGGSLLCVRSGRSAAEILAILEARLSNSDCTTELREAAEQQRQITQLRLRRWLEGSLSMGVSTHILDTARGRPATGVPVALTLEEASVRGALCVAADDGRRQMGDVTLRAVAARGLPTLEAAVPIESVSRRRAYYAAHARRQGLYPLTSMITFTVTDSAEQHYHIPLLLTANGYTTYQG